MWLKLFLSLALAHASERTFDTSVFNKSDKPEIHKKAKRSQERTVTAPTMEAPSAAEMKKSITRIRATTVLLGVEKSPKEIYNLLISRGTSYYKLSRIDRLNSNQTETLKAETADYLNKAKGDFTAASKMKLTNVQSAGVHYMLALISLDQNDYQGGKILLIKALQENREAPFASGVALYLADEDYFSERLDLALLGYTHYLDIMQPKDKARSYYRIAWIHLKKGQTSLAESEFIKLTKLKAPDLRADLLRDLAAVSTQLRNDPRILELVENELKLSTQEEIDFLEEVIREKEGDGKLDSSLLVQRLLKIEKRPLERAYLRVSAVKNAQREKLTPEFEAAYYALYKEIESFPPEDHAKVMKELEDQLKDFTEALVSRMTSAFAEQYHKANKSLAEQSAFTDLAQRLTERLAFLDNNFKVKERPQIYRLWLDVCASEANWNCVLQRVATIQSSPDLASLKEEAQVEKISALEELNKSGPKNYRAKLIGELESFVNDPKRADWQITAQRLSAFYIEDKNYAKAIPLITKIDQKVSNEESYYRLELARFQDNRFQDVIKDKRPQISARIAQLRKESHLKLAQGAVKGGGQQFDQYESNLKEYLAQTTDPAKRLPLLKDYYARLEAKPDLAKLEKELNALDPLTRGNPEIEPFVRRLINTRFIAADFADVVNLIGPSAKQKAEDLRFTAYLANLALHPELAPPHLEALSEERRNYVIGLMVLTDPAAIESSLKAHAASSRQGRDIGLLAIKIRACNPPLELSPTQIDRLGDVTPEELKPHPQTPLERAMGKIKFAKVKTLGAKATASMMQTLDQVRKIRPQVIEGMKKMAPDVQLRVLARAVELEKNSSEMLMTAPVPKGLNPQQTTEYTQGVKDLAAEFVTQATAFNAAAAKLKQHDNEVSAKAKTPVTRPKSENTWPWPSGNPELDKIHKNFAARPLIESLIELDFLKSTNKISERDYYLAREGVLLYKVPCQFMTDYVYNELKSNKQDSLIEAWSKL